jgi:hypothetical protein
MNIRPTLQIDLTAVCESNTISIMMLSYAGGVTFLSVH